MSYTKATTTNHTNVPSTPSVTNTNYTPSSGAPLFPNGTPFSGYNSGFTVLAPGECSRCHRTDIPLCTNKLCERCDAVTFGHDIGAGRRRKK